MLSLYLPLVACESDSAAEPVEVQERTITGTVTDAAGEPLIGASILLKGTSTGTISGMEGDFALQVTDGEPELQVTYVGYEPRTVPALGNESLQIALERE